MQCEVKVVCRFCGHEFWAGLKTDSPVASGRLYEVNCPCNGSAFLFRIVKGRPEPWDEARVYQASEWQPVERFSAIHPLASAFAYSSDVSDR